MKKQFRRTAAAVSALAVCMGSALTLHEGLSADAAYGVGGTGNNIVEYLNRGISAVNTGAGMFVSWRFNADDADDAEFRLYRDNTLIYTSEAGIATSYLDKGGSTASQYRVDTVSGGKVVASEACDLISNQNYFDIPLNKPGNQYNPGDCSVGDVDGDGTYEIFVKWNGATKDNSQDGVTDNVLIDCYTLTGQQLWRIDLGVNIRGGEHYTQFLVADFDGDGKAEMTCKTADGTKDGVGNVIGDASKDYRNEAGRILEGPEYYTLFDGETGAALDTVDYPVPRGKVSDWGDGYGNRVDRFNGAVVYLDGVHPSPVTCRGYYTRMTVAAFDVVDKQLSLRWVYDTGNNEKIAGWGDGNHNCMPADVDNDGKQELVMGATCIDDDGTVLWCNEMGHGDAMHLGDFVPDREGLEVWVCHEEAPWGVSLLDAKDGSIIFHYDGTKDTGRCAADNVYAGNKGAEFWGAASGDVYDSTGKIIGNKRPAMNFFIYWDGDLEREILDGTTISKYVDPNTINNIFTANGCTSINSTKAVPCLSADIFGDWREELVLATQDSTKLRIFCTTSETEYRLTTLMHDVQYRTQVAGEQNCYNQPPHPSFYLGSDAALPERPVVTINGASAGTPTPAVMNTAKTYILRNLETGMYLASDGEKAFQQADSGDPSAMWRFAAVADSYYVLTNAANQTQVLTVIDGGFKVTANAENDTQQLQLFRSGGGYVITTKTSNSENCVAAAAGTSVQEMERSGAASQIWVLEEISYHPAAVYDFVLGDLNGDGKVNAADLTLMKRELIAPVLSRAAKLPADTNADGNITIADAVSMQKYLLGSSTFEAISAKKSFYYAIDAAYGYGVEESANTGFRDTAYVNLDNQIGSFLEWRVTVPEDGTYLCTIANANGSNVNRVMQISVNGSAPQAQDFQSTGAWTTWEETDIVLTLKKGTNTIRMTSDTDQGGPNLDYLIIAKTAA